MNRRGAVLIVTLWIVSILALFAVGLGYRTGLVLKATGYRRDIKMARQAALAGLVWARAVLAQDSVDTDGLYECGLELEDGARLKEVFHEVPVGGGFFTIAYPEWEEDSHITRYGFVDEERKISINGAPFEMLAELPGVGPGLASAIIDWRDENQDPQLDDSGRVKPSGAENEAYEGFPYACKDAPFQAVEELRLVIGMTDEIYREIDPLVTVHGTGKVNINTASREVLGVVARTSFATVGGIERDIDHLITRIIDRRDGFDDEEGTKDDEPFRDIRAEVRQLILGTEERRLAQHMAENYLVTKSNVFRIRALGKLKQPERMYGIETVVSRDGEEKGDLTILFWEEG